MGDREDESDESSLTPSEKRNLEERRLKEMRYNRLFKKVVKYGGQSREKVMRVKFPGFPVVFYDPRNQLVESLSAAVGDDHAITVMDALDVYLATDPSDRLLRFQWNPPNHKAELDKTIKQRDEAILRAERAEEKLIKKTPRRSKPITPKQKQGTSPPSES